MSSKEFSARADSLLRKIISRCYEISTRTPADVFLHYSPHTSDITVFYYPNGWTADGDPVYLRYQNSSSIYFGCEDGIEPLQDILKQLNELRSKYINSDGTVIEECLP